MDENYDVTPLCVLFVIKGTKGDRLLFKYPFDEDDTLNRRNLKSKGGKSPYAARVEEDLFGSRNQSSTSLVKDGDLIGLSDDIIAFLFAVRQEVCAQPLEVKVNDVRFVCFPMMLHSLAAPLQQNSQTGDKNSELPNILLFNICFGLQGNSRRSVVMCYQDLSKRLAIALKHEDGRCQYLTNQAKIMIDCIEEMQNLSPEGDQQSLYKMHLSKSELAQELKQVFIDVKERGFVQLFINRWIKVSFCLPQKIHCFPGIGSLEPEKIRRFIDLMRPYHGMLLLKNVQDLLDEIPADASPDLARLIKVTSPLKSFQTLCVDTDLPITLLFRLVAHLVYWGKATVIYPLCESNVYCISPLASFSSQVLLSDFAECFPSCLGMLAVLSEFSTPVSLGEFTSPLNFDAQQQAERVQMVVWLLKKFMLLQLRTYAYLCCSSEHQKPANFSSDSSKQLSNFDRSFSFAPEDAPVMQQIRILLEKFVKSKAEIDGIFRVYANTASSMMMAANSGGGGLEDLRTFAKLVRYFNGEHHLEDIMFRENLRRHELFRILTRFQEILVTCTHEDELSSVFI